MIRKVRSKRLRWPLFLGLACLAGVWATGAGAQEPCDIALIEAQKLYQNGNFSRVLERLEACSSQGGASRNERLEARRLEAMTYIALDREEEAAAAVVALLRLKANFEATLRDPPQFVRLVEDGRLRASSSQVTSVSKNSESLLEAPAAVIVLDEQEIRHRGYASLEAVLHDLPGFDISRGNGVLYSNIYQRGYRSNGTDRTLFLFDGVEENDLWTNFAHISRQYPLSAIKRVEVIYGPGSTMYGPNAYVGVINVITKDPEEQIDKGEKFGLRVEANGGSWQTRYLDASVAGRHDNLSFSLNGRVFRSDETDRSQYPDWDFAPHEADFYKDKLAVRGLNEAGELKAELFLEDTGLGASHPYYTAVLDDEGRPVAIELTDLGAETAAGFDKAALDAQVGGAPVGYSNQTDDWLLYGKMRLGDLTLGGQTWRRSEGTIGWFPDDREGSSENGALWIPRHTFFYLKYDKAVNDDLFLTSFTRYKSHSLDEENKIFIFRSYAGEGRRGLDSLVEDVPADWADIFFFRISKELRTELKALYSPSERFNLVSGVELRNGFIQVNYVTSFRTPFAAESGSPGSVVDAEGNTLQGDNHHNQRDIGFYSQASYRPAERLKLTLGGRLDNNQVRETEGYGTVFNSRAAAVYTPGPFVLKAIYAEAFKAASNWAKFSTSPSRQLSNPDLEPEKVRNVDLSLGWQVVPGLFVETVGYWSSYSDIVSTAKVILDGNETTQNQPLGQLRIRGIQSSSNWKLGEHRLYANYTFTDSKIVEDAEGRGIDVPVGDIARHRFNLGGTARLPGGLWLNLRMNHVGQRRTGAGTTVEDNPFTRIAAYTVLNGALSYDAPLPGFSVQVAMENLLDKEYFHPGVRSADGKILAARLPQNPRNAVLRLRYDF
jgi:outer membrane receptor for ferrienterochelin and colicins